MDGVLADFDKKWKELYGPKKEPSKEHKKEWKNNFGEFIDNHEFAVLDPMPDMHTLVDYLNDKLHNIPKEILSSTAREESHDKISPQKSLWLSKHDIDWKENFVPGKKHKSRFAKPDAILIDDHHENIDDWNKAGGIGILHKDALTTIALLKLHV